MLCEIHRLSPRLQNRGKGSFGKPKMSNQAKQDGQTVSGPHSGGQHGRYVPPRGRNPAGGRSCFGRGYPNFGQTDAPFRHRYAHAVPPHVQRTPHGRGLRRKDPGGTKHRADHRRRHPGYFRPGISHRPASHSSRSGGRVSARSYGFRPGTGSQRTSLRTLCVRGILAGKKRPRHPLGRARRTRCARWCSTRHPTNCCAPWKTSPEHSAHSGKCA